ncbi:MAG: CHASE3 domain-containing protein, partial [Thermoleophilaceae bacterium]
MIPSNRQLAPARSLPARVIAASAALAAFVGLVFVVLLVAIDEQRQIDARSRNSQQVVAAATQVEKLSVDLETGLRGFQLTGSQQFLAPWRVARAELPDQLARLDRLTDAPGIDPVSRSAAATIVAQLDSYVHGYAEPLVARLDRGPMSHAADVATTDEGKRRFDALRRSLDRLVAAQGARAGARSASVRSHASRLITLGVTGLVVCLLLILLFAIYVHRVLVRPVRSVARAVRQLEDGDSSARVPAMRSPELDDLSRAFNSMAESLTSNRYDLEQAIDQLADGKARIERFEEFGRRMASQSDIEPLAEDVLDQLTEMLDAPVAALYGIRAPQDEVAHLLASRGVARTALPTTVGVDDGTPGRAIDEGRTIEVEDGSGLASRHEIHVPLFLGDRVIGVLTLARTEDRAFDPIEVLSAEYLSRQVAVGIANAVSLRDARRQAAINHAVLETATDA